MKKIFNYLTVCAAAAALLSACKPLDKTYSDLGPVTPVVKVVPTPTVASITLTSTDYAKLTPSLPAYSQQFFHNTTDAFANIPSILSKEYPTAAANSQITVTYATSPVVPVIKLADSTNANTAITLTTTPTDTYKYPAFTYQGASVAANNFDDLSATTVISWLKYNNQTPPPDYTLRVLTFLYFESGATASTGDLQTQSFMFTAATGWQKIYRVSNAQYASVGRGTNNWFLASDIASNLTLPSYFNTFLKNDASVMSTATVGTVIYVNYRYLTTYQRVMPMVWDGVNWVASYTTAQNLFTYNGSVWTGQLDNSVYYTLGAADYTKIGTIAANAPISAGATAITNMVNSADFTLNSSTATSRWTDAQIANSIILGYLTPTYAQPSANQKFYITFKGYSQYPTETYTFIYTATGGFTYQATPDQAKYTLTGDDYQAIGTDATTGATAAAMTNLVSYGDFSMSGASAWTQAQINAGIANVLKTRYTAPTANQTIAVTYAIYSGGNVITTTTFKYGGTAWVAQ